MKKIKLIVNTVNQNYPIIIGKGVASNILKIASENLIKFEKCLIVVDKNIPIKRQQKCKYKSSSGTIEFRVIRQIVERVGMNSEAEKKKVCQNNKIQTENEKLCKVRTVFEQYNLVSALHTFLGTKEAIYNNILPTLSILNKEKKEKLILELNSLDFKL